MSSDLKQHFSTQKRKERECRANQKLCNPKQHDEPFPDGFLKRKRFPKHCWRAATSRSIYVAWLKDLSEMFHGATMTCGIEMY